MNSKRIILTGAAVLMAGLAVAQAPIQREVDVTRAFEPSVQNSLKLGITPDMTDTTQMRPDFNYEITPRPLVYGFAVNPLNPARIATVGDPVRYPFYAKLGVGYPMQSVADVRYAKEINDRSDFGAYLNHYGRWAKIENKMDIKEKATASDNRAGAFYNLEVDRDFRISTGLDYDFRNVTRYGYYLENASPSYFETTDDRMKQYYHDGRFHFLVGNSFTDREKFNMSIGAGIDYFIDRYDYSQMTWDVLADFGFRAGADGFLTIGGNYTGTKGQQNFKDYSGMFGKVGLLYSFDNSDWRVKLGAYFGFTDTKFKLQPGEGEEPDNFKGTFLPEIVLEKDLFDGALTPFVDIRGSVIDNSYRALARRNPYLYSGQFAQNTVSYNGRAGIKGTLGNTFKYSVFGGYVLQDNAAFWANAYSGVFSANDGSTARNTAPFYGNEGNVFTVLTDDLNYFEAGVEVLANILNTVTLNGGFHYYGYSPDQFEEAWGMPEIGVDFGVAYNYRNRLYLNAAIEYLGERKMFSNRSTGLVNTVSGQTNLKFGAEYFISKQFGVFLQLNNLLNQDIIHFNRHPELGINGLAGIKISF